MNLENRNEKIPVRRRRAGFTLIEVLLVVVIISILVAMAVPRFGGRAEQARIARA